jgi:hypothetical protein
MYNFIIIIKKIFIKKIYSITLEIKEAKFNNCKYSSEPSIKFFSTTEISINILDKTIESKSTSSEYK